MQIQSYIQSTLELHEQDRKLFESRTEKYTVLIKKIRDIPLPIIGFLIALFFSLASLKIFDAYESMFMIIALIFSAVAVFLYILLTSILDKISIISGMVYASRLSSMLRLIELKNLLVNFTTFDDELLKLFNYTNFLMYIRLNSAMKVSYLHELERISNNKLFLPERIFYRNLIKREEGILFHFYNFYLENKNVLLNDEFIVNCEKQLSTLSGGQSIFQMYDQLESRFIENEFEDKDLGLRVVLPRSWIIERKAHEDADKALNIILIASPHLICDTKFMVSTIKESLNERDIKKHHEENVDSFDTILESESTNISGISGHKLVYKSSFKTLVNKTMEIWLPIKRTVYEIKFEASNESQYELFLPDFEKILSSIQFDKA